MLLGVGWGTWRRPPSGEQAVTSGTAQVEHGAGLGQQHRGTGGLGGCFLSFVLEGSLLIPAGEEPGGQSNINLIIRPSPPLRNSRADLPVSRGLLTVPRIMLYPRRVQTSFEGHDS